MERTEQKKKVRIFSGLGNAIRGLWWLITGVMFFIGGLSIQSRILSALSPRSGSLWGMVKEDIVIWCVVIWVLTTAIGLMFMGALFMWGYNPWPTVARLLGMTEKHE